MNFAQLALICGVAILGPLLSLSKSFAVPVAIGELAVGIVLGATGLGLLRSSDQTFSFLADIGFGLVMFVAGTHVPMRDPALRSGARTGLVRAAAIGLVAVPAGLGLAHLFGTGNGLLYAVLIASSSASIIMPALSGVPLTAPAISAMLPQLAVADAVCIVLLPLVIDPANVVRAAIGALAVLVAAVGVFLVFRSIEATGVRRRIHNLSEDRGLALELRVSLTVLFSLAALATFAHVTIMLAGFAVGLAYAAVGPPRRLANQVFGLTEGFFGPIFFVWLGASLNLRDLAAHPAAVGLGLALGGAAVVVHLMPVVAGQLWPAAVATSAQLGVPVAAATLGSQLGVLAPGENTALLVGAMVTIIAMTIAAGPLTALAAAGPATSDPNEPGRAGGGVA